VIAYCHTHDKHYDTDWHTECPDSDENNTFCTNCCECVNEDGGGHQDWCSWSDQPIDYETGLPKDRSREGTMKIQRSATNPNTFTIIDENGDRVTCQYQAEVGALFAVIQQAALVLAPGEAGEFDIIVRKRV